jgi:hypothetical protein
LEEQLETDSLKLRVIAAAVANGWDRAAPREKLDDNVGQILQDMKTGRPAWNDTGECSPIYKSNWVQWNSLLVRRCARASLGVGRQKAQDIPQNLSIEHGEGIRELK